MKVNLKFTDSDFESFKSFQSAVKKQLGNDVYVGPDALCLYFQYPPSLSAMLRPFPKQVQLEFELTSEDPSKGK